MDDAIFDWDDEHHPKGNFQHISLNGVTPEEFQDVVEDEEGATIPQSDGTLITFGHTRRGRHLAAVWEHVNDDPLIVRPVTAYDVEERMSLHPKKRKRRW